MLHLHLSLCQWYEILLNYSHYEPLCETSLLYINEGNKDESARRDVSVWIILKEILRQKLNVKLITSATGLSGTCLIKGEHYVCSSRLISRARLILFSYLICNILFFYWCSFWCFQSKYTLLIHCPFLCHL